ncbi:dihydrolipoyl dehydrogenase [Roseateles oligotrophus]|uniref:Dihydrolipoyl dehydrogenase n=1 Tax=Roseateles oligotrophus TaxID=1769250 RepID=A0ABT2YLP3_9BURK|nr:dihydrolipoyl dehydrogenase [Roseateles oligotrophus]MCV2370917.1 dihydrolipoyl dehydrogenase [Roseateles oligotrophus]
MKQIQVDVAIIGAGTAGMSAYRAALAHTPSVLVIEDGPYGTTCARVGCMPSKLLIAAAEAAHSVNRLAGHAKGFGVRAGPAQIDGVAVMQRVREERDRFVGFVTDAVEHWPAEHRLRGRAKFLDDQRLQIDAHSVVTAKRIVIATGSRPNVPTEWIQTAGDRLIVNDDVFAWADLPKSVAVLGAGVIALELAQALHRLGVRVRLYGRSERIGPLTDPALQALTRQIIVAELPVQMSAKDITLERDDNEVIVRAAGREARFDWVLAASGRQPNLQGLGLENTGLPLDPRGVPVFDRRSGQIGVSPVFIAGDVNAELEILHEAADEGRIAGDNAGRFPDVRVRPRRAPLAIVFSDPQIMIAGLSHAQLLRSGVGFESGTVSFEDQGRSRVMLKNQGALHLYAERGNGRLLGAEMIGPAAEHIGHLLAWSIQRGDTVQDMLDSPFYHPVIEEGLRTALRLLQRALHMGPPPVERCLDCGPGA